MKKINQIIDSYNSAYCFAIVSMSKQATAFFFSGLYAQISMSFVIGQYPVNPGSKVGGIKGFCKVAVYLMFNHVRHPTDIKSNNRSTARQWFHNRQGNLLTSISHSHTIPHQTEYLTCGPLPCIVQHTTPLFFQYQNTPPPFPWRLCTTLYGDFHRIIPS